MADIITPHAVVTVDGVARPASSVSITREISTDLPASVTGGGGLVAATGTVEWAPHVGGLETRSAHPSPGQRVEISRGVNGPTGALFKGFTGYVDETSGRASTGALSSTVVDDIGVLDKAVTLPTHFAKEVGRYGIVTTELSAAWLAYEVGRMTGLSAYHYSPSTAMLWVSFAGSLLPSFTAIPNYLHNDAWDAVQTPTGVGITLAADNVAHYPMAALSDNGGRSVEWSWWADPSIVGTSTQVILVGNDPVADYEAGWRVSTRDGYVTVSTYSSKPEDPDTVILYEPASGWQPIAAHVYWGSGGWALKVRIGSTVHSLPIQADPDNAVTRAGSNAWGVYVQSGSVAGNARIAGLVVDRLPTTSPVWAEHSHVSRLSYRFGSNLSGLLRWLVQPPQYARSGLDVLREVASGECASLWIDEDGVLQYVNRFAMAESASTKTLTAQDSLIDLDWTDSLASLRSRVVVKWRRPSYSVRPTWTLTAWTPGDSDTTLKQEDGDTVWIVEPDADTDWLNPDFGLSLAAKGGRVNGSWWGGTVKTDSTNAVVRTAASGDVTVTSETLTDSKAILTMSTTASVLASQYVAVDGPVVKAQGVAKWTDMSTTVTSTLGPLALAPELVHEPGWVIQTENQAITVGNYLANLTAKPLIQLDRVEVQPDPSIRLGDRVTIKDSVATGLAVDGIVFRIEEKWSDGSASMSLGVRVTSATKEFATLAEHDARWAGASLATLDAAWSGKTMALLDANPLL